MTPNQAQGSIDVEVTQVVPGAAGAPSAGGPAIPGPAAHAGQPGQPAPAAPVNPTNPSGAANATPPTNPPAAGAAGIRWSAPGACIGLAVTMPYSASNPCAPPAAPAAPGGPAQPGQPAVTAAAIRQVVQRYMQRLPLPAPGIHLNPAHPAIVNFPTIVNADPPPAGRFTVNQPGFPRIDISASCHWHWDFGDGTTATADWPGRPYDGTLPADNPGHYLLHTYHDPATRTVTVTTIWSATYTVAGQPATVAGQATATTMTGTVTRTSSATLPVREYAANLVP